MACAAIVLILERSVEEDVGGTMIVEVDVCSTSVRSLLGIPGTDEDAFGRGGRKLAPEVEVVVVVVEAIAHNTTLVMSVNRLL